MTIKLISVPSISSHSSRVIRHLNRGYVRMLTHIMLIYQTSDRVALLTPLLDRKRNLDCGQFKLHAEHELI